MLRVTWKPSKTLMSSLSQNPRAVAARDRKERKEAIDLEAYRKELREKILKYGSDYSKWPESKPKIVEGESCD